jgi:hypothetical protein
MLEALLCFLDLLVYLLQFLFQVFFILLEHVQILLLVGKGLEPLEVETEGRKAKVEPSRSPTPHIYSPPEPFTPEKLRFSGDPRFIHWYFQAPHEKCEANFHRVLNWPPLGYSRTAGIFSRRRVYFINNYQITRIIEFVQFYFLYLA